VGQIGSNPREKSPQYFIGGILFSWHGVPSLVANLNLFIYLERKLLNIKQLCSGAPVFVSLPHFLNADEDIQNSIDGLKADPAIHTTYLNVEPYTGTFPYCSATYRSRSVRPLALLCSTYLCELVLWFYLLRRRLFTEHGCEGGLFQRGKI
jgi:hypothetical protein